MSSKDGFSVVVFDISFEYIEGQGIGKYYFQNKFIIV